MLQETINRGNKSEAIALFQHAFVLDPTPTITPSVGNNRDYAAIIAGQIMTLAQSSEITTSLAAIQRALQFDPQVVIDGKSWNEVCWNGALEDMAGQVLQACDNAIAAAPENGYFRASRALARALTGDIAGAIEDFEFFVKWAKQTGNYETLIDSRLQYVADLKAGKNPFTPEVLQQLRNQ